MYTLLFKGLSKGDAFDNYLFALYSHIHVNVEVPHEGAQRREFSVYIKHIFINIVQRVIHEHFLHF